ncbi:MAG: DNA gyrase inhibitor YacG [Betaproteobacteria bacterium]|nr:DNA gyrase inhibitor YacG [Betaproteobacteria bacterium]
MPERKPQMVNCPQCSMAVAWEEANPFRPFCSERCRLIDLGQWASESYRIPSEKGEGTHNPESPEERGRGN